MQLTITTTHDINAAFVSNIFIGAIEGGVVYWADHYEELVKDKDGNWLSLRIWAEDHGEKDGYHLDGEKIVAAIKKILEENIAREDIVESIRKDVIAGGDGDGNMDSECNDIIIQVACFGEIVFG